MPKKVDKDNIKMLILEAFQRCMLMKPLYKVSMRDIAKEAGISHAKIFYYFETKEELVIEYVRYVTSVYADFYTDIFDKAINVKGDAEILNNMIHQLYATKDREIYGKIFMQVYAEAAYSHEIYKIVQDTYRSWMENILAGLEKLYGKGQDKSAKSLFFFLEGLAMLLTNTELLEEDAVEIIPTLMKLINEE